MVIAAVTVTLAAAWFVLTSERHGIANSQPRTAACGVTTASEIDRDLARARGACDRAGDRFTLLFGTPPPAGRLEVSDTVRFFSATQEGAEWSLIWPATEQMAEFFAANPPQGQEIDDAIEEQWSTVLPHELGHLMLIAEADRRRPTDRDARRLPDWLHEGTAVWMEPPAHRREEYALLPAHRPYVPPLDEILNFRIATPDGREAGSTITRTFYPCASEEACGGRPYWNRIFSVRTRQFPDGSVRIDTIFHEEPPPPPSPLASNFYAYSALLVRYIHHRGGTEAMSSLLDRAVRAEGGESLLVGLPGLPRSPTAVQADWEAWFARWIFATEGPADR